MGRKFVLARRSQIVSSIKRHNEEMSRTEEDVQPIDIEFWKKAQEKQNRKNGKRLRLINPNAVTVE